MTNSFWKRGKEGRYVTADRPEDDDGLWTLGSFEIVREIGRGSMGVVYLGRETASGREVAIKAMALAEHFNHGALENALGQFLREARLLIWLNHPDIVSIHDVGEEQGLAYIAMEIVNGVKLTEFIRPENLLSLQETLEIIARVADVLGYADEQNIAHRDIKPGNIMYDAEQSTVKVMDFGISRMTHSRASMLNMVQGSPRYMSPEQVRDELVDGRSDLFSLGITLYQLVSGKLPFEGDNEKEVMTRIAREVHTDILSHRPDVPACVREIINRALQKDKGQRYRNGHEMAEALRRCAAALRQD